MKKYLPALLCLFLGVSAFGQAGTGVKKVVADKIAAVVGDRIILYSDIKNTIDDYRRQGADIPDNAQCLIMEQALVSKVLMLQAEKDSLEVTDDEVEAELEQKIRYFIREYGDQATLEQVAGKTIYQIKDDARESVREQKLAQAMQRKIVEGVHITPTEVKEYFNKIPVDSLPYFESELEVGQIVVFPKASRDLEKYVIDELNNYKRQVQSKLATFEQLAKRFSEDPGSKERGGLYQVNRNDKSWDPTFLAAAFRLREGEISNVIKTKFGYHIIQMEQRNGDEAIIRHILRIPPVTQDEINEAISKLDTVRSNLIAGNIEFGQAADKYSEDEQAKYSGPFFIGASGAPYVKIDELDKDVVATLAKMKIGEYSQPVAYDNNGKKAVRILYFKSRSEPHRMNLEDDYAKISQMALEEKKGKAVDKWLNEKIPSYYTMIDDEFKSSCPRLQGWGEEKKAF